MNHGEPAFPAATTEEHPGRTAERVNHGEPARSGDSTRKDMQHWRASQKWRLIQVEQCWWLAWWLAWWLVWRASGGPGRRRQAGRPPPTRVPGQKYRLYRGKYSEIITKSASAAPRGARRLPGGRGLPTRFTYALRYNPGATAPERGGCTSSLARFTYALQYSPGSSRP